MKVLELCGYWVHRQPQNRLHSGAANQSTETLLGFASQFVQLRMVRSAVYVHEKIGRGERDLFATSGVDVVADIHSLPVTNRCSDIPASV